jgi:Flp pilus assembly protein TadD
MRKRVGCRRNLGVFAAEPAAWRLLKKADVARNGKPSLERYAGYHPARRRSVKLARRGEYRKAAVVLRELLIGSENGAVWVRMGILLLKAGRTKQAMDALKQGAWVHARSQHPRRADAVWAVIRRLDGGMASAA